MCFLKVFLEGDILFDRDEVDIFLFLALFYLHSPLNSDFAVSSDLKGTAAYVADSVNSCHPINPMQTKRVKCTVQPSSEFHDGVGDQIESSADDSKRLSQQNLPSQRSMSSDIMHSKSTSDVSSQVEANSEIIINPSQGKYLLKYFWIDF